VEARESNPRKMPRGDQLRRRVALDESADILHEHHQVQRISWRLLEPVLLVPRFRSFMLCVHKKDSNTDSVSGLDAPKQDVLQQ
jgi:hypothetical protein